MIIKPINDTETRQIVQNVVKNITGSPQTEPAPASPVGKRIVALDADHSGFELKSILKTDIESLGSVVMDVGTNSKEPVDYTDFAHSIAQMVGTGRAWRGIMIDGAGIGSCIVAYKVPM
jgi:ribose 5-phosphate isomerase B